MTLKEFGNSLETTPFWKEGFVIWFFNLLPAFLAVLTIATFFLMKKFHNSQIRKVIIAFSLVIGISLLAGIWSYNIERFDLKIQTQQVNLGFKAKVALIADLHIGRFKDKTWMERVINETNKIENLDAVLVAGDWTYWPKDISKEGL
jgi:hypothetical protein